jgi:TolA-binding protein
MVRGMQRNVVLGALLAAALAATPRLAAQDPATEADKQYVNKRLELLEESIAAHQKSVQSLTDEVRKLKDEIDRLRNKNEGSASQDSIKRLQEAIVEVDKKRLADGERIAKTFEDLRKLILEKPTSARAPGIDTRTSPVDTRPPAGGPTPPPSNKGYKYAIRSGDTLSALVTALRKEGHKVTSKIIMDANPGVNWNRLKVGQEIFIPETR